jgi:hypothetical protein
VTRKMPPRPAIQYAEMVTGTFVTCTVCGSAVDLFAVGRHTEYHESLFTWTERVAQFSDQTNHLLKKILKTLQKKADR